LAETDIIPKTHGFRIKSVMTKCSVILGLAQDPCRAERPISAKPHVALGPGPYICTLCAIDLLRIDRDREPAKQQALHMRLNYP